MMWSSIIIGGLLFASLSVTGCATHGGQSSLFAERAAMRDLNEAQRLVKARQFSVAVPRLVHILSTYPDTPAAADASYLLGRCYYALGGYRDAAELFRLYLRLAPEGPYRPSADEYLRALANEYDTRYPSDADVQSDIETLRAKLAAEPETFEHKWKLADLLWKQGDYEEAGVLYVDMLDRYPELEENTTIISRLDMMPDGDYVLLTPKEIQRRQIEQQPLEIYNINSFRAGEDRKTRESRFYVVSGQVRNRRDSTLYDVQVIVTIYGFGNVVYDTRTVNIGQLRANETRPFSVRFNTFEDIENIHRYECVGTFLR